MKLFIIIFLLLVDYLCLNANEVVFEFSDNLNEIDSTIKSIESLTNLRYKRNIFDSFHSFKEIEKLSKRSKRHIDQSLLRLKNNTNIKWFQIQHDITRVKREYIENHVVELAVDNFFEEILDKSNLKQMMKLFKTEKIYIKKCSQSKYDYNDPSWPYQWYMNDGCIEGINLNITFAWDMGYTGKGIVVCIIDDGVERTNIELIENYDQNASTDLNDADNDPQPRYDITDENKHGTRCAGEVAAKANNSICGVGIAHNARIGGIRLLDGRINDRKEADALTFKLNYIDIFSASWGPLDNGETVEGPGRLANIAFQKGITEGRNNKGVIYVWASGNGGRLFDNCNCDGYTSSIYTVTITGMTKTHKMPSYSEKCSSILAATYSSGIYNDSCNIITSDLHNKCTRSHSGTSASAPLGGAIIALALEANNELTWRDVQYLIIYTSEARNFESYKWTRNGIGRLVSHEFGYGLMNAGRLVDLARKWNFVGEQLACDVLIVETNSINQITVPSMQIKLFSAYLTTNNNTKFNSQYKLCDKNINYLEHVITNLSLNSTKRGDIRISLISPFGTESNLLDHRPLDKSKNGFKNWPFMSVHYWGENLNGEWILKIENNNTYDDIVLLNWSFKFYGIKELNNKI